MPTKRLTKLFITGIKPPATGRVEYWDSASPGLALRVTSNGHKSWSLFYRVDGKFRRHTIGPYVNGKAREEFDLPAAHAKADELRSALRKGIDPGIEKKARRASVDSDDAKGFGAAARRWLDEHVKKNCAPSTYKETARVFENDVIPAWSGRSLDSIAYADVDALVAKIARPTAHRRGAEVQANRVLARVKAFFNWATSKRLLAVSPAAGMKPPTKEIPRDRVLSDDEIKAFWLACEEIGWPFGPLFKLLLLTAQRRDEVGGMEWSEIDFERRLWEMPKEKAKNKRAHQIQLSDQAITILQSLPNLGRFVFSTNGATQVSGFSRAKRRLDAAMTAALGHSAPEWILHDLRRTATSGMASLNVPPHVADRILNHISGTIRGVAATYNKFEYGPERRAALAAWSNYVENLIEPTASNVVAMRA